MAESRRSWAELMGLAGDRVHGQAPAWEPSPDQVAAVEQLRAWYAGTEQARTLGGYAGTGKTALIARLEDELPARRVRYCAPTGKATHVLRQRLRDAGRRTVAHDDDGYPRQLVTTIHALLYRAKTYEFCGCGRCGVELVEPSTCARPVRGEHGPLTETRYESREQLDDVDLLVVDEASMVGEELWKDLLATGCRVLAVGDHGQLEPVGDDRFNLMERPDVRLERVHRQAGDSPIIRLSMMAREGERIAPGEYGPGVLKIARPPDNLGPTDGDRTLAICGRNRLRKRLNTVIRSGYGRPPGSPVAGDRVICLRNYRTHGLFNGLVGTVRELTPPPRSVRAATAVIDLDSRATFRGEVYLPQFNEDELTAIRQGVSATLWDYAYVVTCHKAQGSEADDVVVFDDPVGDPRRWLYTAITRARRNLLLIGP